MKKSKSLRLCYRFSYQVWCTRVFLLRFLGLKNLPLYILFWIHSWAFFSSAEHQVLVYQRILSPNQLVLCWYFLPTAAVWCPGSFPSTISFTRPQCIKKNLIDPMINLITSDMLNIFLKDNWISRCAFNGPFYFVSCMPLVPITSSRRSYPSWFFFGTWI